MPRLSWCWLLAAVGCGGTVTFDQPGDLPTGGDDSDGVVDSDVVVDPTDPRDTDVAPGETDGVDTGGPQLSWSCHAWDPAEDAGWAAVYALQVGDVTMTEQRQAKGVTTVPQNVAGAVAVGFKVDSVITGGSAGNQTLSRVVVCNTANGRTGAFDIGMKSINAAGTVNGGANNPGRYLPAREALADSSASDWEETTVWTLRVPVQGNFGACPAVATVELTVEESFTVIGNERLTGTAVGAVDAWRVQARTERSFEVQGSPVCNFFVDVSDFFATSAFTLGYNANNDSFPIAVVDRWYARGVGLIKEEGKRVGGAQLWSRELTACEGLVGCR